MTRTRWVRVLALCVVPVGGTATLACGLVQSRHLPSPVDLHRLQALGLEQTRIRHDLMLKEPTSQDALCERLPRTLTVGTLLRRLERAAREAGVRAVSFGTEDDAAPEPNDADTPPADAAEAPDPTDVPRPRADVLRCQITLEAEYRALVLFLGLVESMPETTRVRSLAVTPCPTGVSATIGLEGYAYAGDGAEPASLGPASSPAPEAPR